MTSAAPSHRHARRPTNRGGHPTPPEWSAQLSTRLIWVYEALSTDAALSRITHMVSAANQCTRSVNTAQTEALTVAKWTLRQTSQGHYSEAQQRGQLLYCWHGTALLNPPTPKAKTPATPAMEEAAA